MNTKVNDPVYISGEIISDQVFRRLGIRVASFGCSEYVVDIGDKESQWISLGEIGDFDNIDAARLKAATMVYCGKTVASDVERSSEFSVAEVVSRCNEQVPINEYYEQIKALRIEFGHSFRSVNQLWKGDEEAIGRVSLPSGVDGEGYFIHPVMLDACFQVFGATLFSNENQKTYVPVGIGNYKLNLMGVRSAWSHVVLKKTIKNEDMVLWADIRFYDEASNPLGYIKDFSLALIEKSNLLEQAGVDSFRDSLYETFWEQSPLENKPQAVADESKWMVLSDSEDRAKLLLQQMNEAGKKCSAYVLGKRKTGGDIASVAMESLGFLVEELAQHSNDGPLDGVLLSFGNESNESVEAHEDFEHKVEKRLEALLAVVNSLNAIDLKKKVKLYINTDCSQQVNDESLQGFMSSPLWGLGRVAAREASSISCVLLDTDAEAFNKLVHIIDYESEIDKCEEQVVWRGDERYVARLRHMLEGALNQDFSKPYRLKISEYGTFDNFFFEELKRSKPKSDCVEIEIAAAPLNFKDVLHALGMLQSVGGEQSGVSSNLEMLFGGECSGIITSAGDDVTDFKIGDRVVATMAFGSFGSHVTVDARFVSPIPDEMSFEEAATIPTSFITAYYALITCAQIQSGDTVLIHAGTGGLGMAAIQVAKAVGATVYATASPSKWPVLEKLGVEKIMNSRTLEFAEELSTAPFDGVDIVLNCLSGDFIEKSFDVLRDGGRFIEVGKIGIRTEEEVSRSRPDCSYFAFDLMDFVQEKPDQLSSILTDVIALMVKNEYTPLPVTNYDVAHVIDAFKLMAQAQHTGKIVISMKQNSQAEIAPAFEKDASYLITGGTGAIGLEVAKFLVESGAEHVIIASRNKPSEDVQKKIAKLNATASVVHTCLDLSDYSSVKALFESSTFPRVGGVFHAAGVLEDGLLSGLNWEKFEKVLSPKALGAWNLHLATAKTDLKYFVCFSSVAGVLGAPGQGNYAAANTFLDSLCEYRRSSGMSGLSIAWGAWDGTGMAGELKSKNRERFSTNGTRLISTRDGIETLHMLMEKGAKNCIVLPVDWASFFRKFPGSEIPEFYSLIMKSNVFGINTGKGVAAEYIEALGPLEPAARLEKLCEVIQRMTAEVIQASGASSVSVDADLVSLGVDSLMGMELRAKVQKVVGVQLPASVLMNNPSILTLAQAGLVALFPNEKETGREFAKDDADEAKGWFVCNEPRVKPKLRLFCFHHSGGNARIFQSWSKSLPDSIEVHAIQLPGRDFRSHEDPVETFKELLDSVIPEILPLLDNTPFAFYGHSLGALMAYETAYELVFTHGKTPAAMFAGALWAPLDCDIHRHRTLKLTSFEIPEEVISDTEFVAELQSVFDQDWVLLRSYYWTREDLPEFPIVSFFGEDDEVVKEEEVRRWEKCTSGSFNCIPMKGKHMFLVDEEDKLLREISSAISAELPIVV